MKAFKKLSMLFVAVAMMMTTVSTAFAAGETSVGNGNLKIDRNGATYNVYKVLGSKNKQVNGNNLVMYTETSDFKGFFDGTSYKFDVDQGILVKNDKGEFEVMETSENDGLAEITENDPKPNAKVQSEKSKMLTKELIDFIEENSIKPTDSINGMEDNSLTQGYYLVVETTESIKSDGTSTGRVPSLAMLINVNPQKAVHIIPKDASIDIVKKVNNQDDNVAGVGDILPFSINSSIPTYAENYKNIKYSVTDNMSKGLTLDETTINITVDSIKVVENGVVLHKDYLKNLLENDKLNIKKEEATGNTIMTFEFNYDKLKNSALAGKNVHIEYKAEINTDAVVFDANTNTAQLDYTVNPNGKTDGIVDHTDTYTYGLQLLKIDGNATENDKNATNPLAGATFKVTKVTENGDVITDVNDVENTDRENLGKITTGDDGILYLAGLGEGFYQIEEVTAPEGFVKLDGHITIHVTANSDKKTATIELKESNGDIASIVEKADNGNIQLTVKNYKGINLPETGGMGTTIFMIGGAALIALAGVMLVVYSKKSKKA